MSERAKEPETDWPHAPRHILSERGTYCVTAATLYHRRIFNTPTRLGVMHRGLLKFAKKWGWDLEAWAVFATHYHFIAHSPEDPRTLEPMCKELHAETSRWVNRIDSELGRRVWYEFYDTQLTSTASYLARLNYVHQNAVRHGLVQVARDYPFCSAAWFERMASEARVKKIYAMKTDKVTIPDNFSV